MHKLKTLTPRGRIVAALVLLAALAVGAVALASPDADDRVPVTIAAGVGGAHGEVLCLTASTVKVGGLVERRSIMVQNLGPNAVYLCPDSTCTSGDGIKLESGSDRAFDWRTPIELYCRGVTADQLAGAGLRFLEVR